MRRWRYLLTFGKWVLGQESNGDYIYMHSSFEEWVPGFLRGTDRPSPCRWTNHPFTEILDDKTKIWTSCSSVPVLRLGNNKAQALATCRQKRSPPPGGATRSKTMDCLGDLNTLLRLQSCNLGVSFGCQTVTIRRRRSLDDTCWSRLRIVGYQFQD